MRPAPLRHARLAAAVGLLATTPQLAPAQPVPDPPASRPAIAPAPPPSSRGAAGPATQPSADEDYGITGDIVRVLALPALPPLKLADAIAVTINQDGRLDVTSNVPEAADNRLIFTDRPGATASITVRPQVLTQFIYCRALPAPPPSATTLPNTPITPPADGDGIRIEALGAPIPQINAHWYRNRSDTFVELFQGALVEGVDRPARLTVKLDDRLIFEARAPDVATLNRQQRAAMIRFVRPLLAEIGSAEALFPLDDREGWEILAPWAPSTPETQAKLTSLLPRLDAEDPATREAAAKDLTALGQPAANALAAWDRAKLTPQQNAEVDAFLAAFSPLAPDAAAEARQSPAALAMFLESPNPTLRRAAWTRLQSLVPSLRSFPPFNPDAPAEARNAALESLRATFGLP